MDVDDGTWANGTVDIQIYQADVVSSHLYIFALPGADGVISQARNPHDV